MWNLRRCIGGQTLLSADLSHRASHPERKASVDTTLWNEILPVGEPWRIGPVPSRAKELTCKMESLPSFPEGGVMHTSNENRFSLEMLASLIVLVEPQQSLMISCPVAINPLGNHLHPNWTPERQHWNVTTLSSNKCWLCQARAWLWNWTSNVCSYACSLELAIRAQSSRDANM